MNIGIVGPINPYEFKSFFLNAEVPNINPNATSVNTFIRELLDKGEKVYAFTSAYSIPNNIILESNQLKIYIISRKLKYTKFNILSNFYIVRRLITCIYKEIPKLNVLHAQWTYEYATAAKYFTKQLPVFCTVRDWCPYILSLQKELIPKLYWLTYYYHFKNVMSCDDIHFLANSYYTYNCIKKNYPNKSDVTIINNPIEKNLILLKKKNTSKEKIFISISQDILNPRKNYTNLLYAFRKYHKYDNTSKLWLIGKYNKESPIYRKWNKEQLLEGVTFMGQISHKNLIEKIDLASVLIHPSLEETFGNTLIEGMARRILVIGGESSGAVPEVLDHGNNGILCDVTNVESIYQAMILSNNEDIIKEKVNTATEFIESNYKSDIIVQKHLQLYKSYM